MPLSLSLHFCVYLMGSPFFPVFISSYYFVSPSLTLSSQLATSKQNVQLQARMQLVVGTLVREKRGVLCLSLQLYFLFLRCL